MRPLWIEVDLRALRNNFKVIKNYVGPKVKIAATIKQNAYGYGFLPVARELANQGVDFFGVGSLEEAIVLREDGFKGSILVLSAVLDKFVSFFIQYNITPTVVDGKFARKLNNEAKKNNKIIPVHVKVDTGMSRLGFGCRKSNDFINQIVELRNICLEGIYTHFSSAEDDLEFTNFQIEQFNQLINKLKEKNINFKFSHCANSGGILNYPNAHFNMVRPGIILFGVNFLENVNLKFKSSLNLKARVIFVKNIPRGSKVGYGQTYIVSESTNIATVSIGYADGYPWSLSNKAEVIIKNKRYKIAGRVCMDHIMVDLGKTKGVKPGDEVILVGRTKDLKVTVEDLASWAQTIPYEIISRFSLKIPRIYKFSSF